MEPQFVMSMWQAHKITHDLAIKELYRTRACASQKFIEQVRSVQQHEKEQRDRAEWRELCKMLQKSLRPFIHHPIVEQWKAQFTAETYGVFRRFKFLVLRGDSQAGKTVFAENLWGEAKTIVLQCQGLGSDLPSIRDLDRADHKCIVFDEIHHSAVLNNKVLFQAGKNFMDLAQSKCGGFRYSLLPYQVALICCSNHFAVTKEEGLEKDEDEDWLQKNALVVNFGKGDTCFQPSSLDATKEVAGAGA